MCRACTHDVRVVSLYLKEKCSCPARSMCYHIGSNAQLGCTGNLKKETLHSFERIHSPRKIKNLAENDQELMDDIREEHKIGMHVTLVYHPYKLIYHAEQVPENETRGWRGKLAYEDHQ